MKNKVEMDSVVMIYTTSFMKMGNRPSNVGRGYTYRDTRINTQKGDLISLLYSNLRN
jgi:hypothetical protein